MAIQIGKYKRPGIFIEEIDRSIITSPTQDLGTPNLVIGVSRRGPVNTPIEVKNISEIQSIFGDIDRQLEKKGSFFHRTLFKMIESSPVYAVNLLLTDDELDTVEYRSLSGSAQYTNDTNKEAPFRKFFDTTGFWKRSTGEFISVSRENSGYEKRVLNFTNLGDRYISVFCFKSQRTGFDRPMLEWYGSSDKMPPYVYPTDFASDYLVDVLVVGGDWSDAQSLGNDPRWNRYFNSEGLRKDRVREFTNDRNVSVLSFYEGVSMIPYFRDLDGRNIFIESVINRDTDKTGLFCAFNDDLFETAYPTGLVDLIGNSLVGDDLMNNPPTIDETYYNTLDANDGSVDGELSVNFLSYKEKLTETSAFPNVVLDRPGNVTGLFGTFSSFDHAYDSIGGEGGVYSLDSRVYNEERTYWFAEGFVNQLTYDGYATPSTGIQFDYISGSNSYAVINGNYVTMSAGTHSASILSSFYSSSATLATYSFAVVLTSQGEIKAVTTRTAGTSPTVSASDVVLGSGTLSMQSGVMSFGSYTNLTIGANGYLALQPGVDYTIATSSTVEGALIVTFDGTDSTPVTSDYATYRKFKTFNSILSYIDTSNSFKGVMLMDPDGLTVKKSLSEVTISDIRKTTTVDKAFTIQTGLAYSELGGIIDGDFKLIFYKKDDEMIFGYAGFETKDEIADLSGPTDASIGVVGKYSTFYTSYTQGNINSTDVVYQNAILGTATVSFVEGVNAQDYLEGYNYLVFAIDDASVNTQSFEDYFTTVEDEMANAKFYQFLIGGVSNSGVFTVKIDEGLDSTNTAYVDALFPSSITVPVGPEDRAEILGYTASSGIRYFAYEVNETVVTEIYQVSKLFGYSPEFDDQPIYLQMYVDSDDKLFVRYKDYKLATGGSPSDVYLQTIYDSLSGDGLNVNSTLYVKSKKGDFKQSIEAEYPNGWTPIPNKILIKKDRYGRIKVGDFLEAQYDVTTLASDQMPKKLTRITQKKLWSVDTNYIEVSCDAPIKLYNYPSSTSPDGFDRQTIRRTSLDDYTTSYKAISLKGFRIRNESLPDGTDSRQNDILDVVAPGTALFGALTNKDAFDFRYLVDAFGLGLTEDSKQNLVDICGARLDCFGIINMPSLRQFKNSVSPNFKDASGVLSMEFVSKGGDPESNPDFLYSFAKGPGVTSAGYFLPYVSINDYGRVIEIPPAAYVATTFMRKFNQSLSTITPWTVAAGVNNGRIIGIDDIEQIFAPTDLEFLNQAQMNPLTFKRNRGYIIETDNTAQVLVKSSLSEIHVREVLIELERELSTMLLDFQWRINTPETRASIKLAADVICEKYVSGGGLFNYFNKIDEENNPLEIVDAGIGVLDTYVEPIRAMGIIVNNITILRTGAIQAGGFIIS